VSPGCCAASLRAFYSAERPSLRYSRRWGRIRRAGKQARRARACRSFAL
jgi:hypothetical protein